MTTLEVRAADGVSFRSVLAAPYALVADGAVVQILDRRRETHEAEPQTRAARQNGMEHVRLAGFGGVGGAEFALVGGEVCALREDEEPCRVQGGGW